MRVTVTVCEYDGTSVAVMLSVGERDGASDCDAVGDCDGTSVGVKVFVWLLVGSSEWLALSVGDCDGTSVGV